MSWTDHNVHDPGVTLLELFAFLGETLASYNDPVAAQRRKRFLRYAFALAPLGALIFLYRRSRRIRAP